MGPRSQSDDRKKSVIRAQAGIQFDSKSKLTQTLTLVTLVKMQPGPDESR
jgi:hypothetical protein